jgi:hypothetical protein
LDKKIRLPGELLRGSVTCFVIIHPQVDLLKAKRKIKERKGKRRKSGKAREYKTQTVPSEARDLEGVMKLHWEGRSQVSIMESISLKRRGEGLGGPCEMVDPSSASRELVRQPREGIQTTKGRERTDHRIEFTFSDDDLTVTCLYQMPSKKSPLAALGKESLLAFGVDRSTKRARR